MRKFILVVDYIEIHVIQWKDIWLNAIFDNLGNKPCTKYIQILVVGGGEDIGKQSISGVC